jgi:hypothetical protein
MEWSQYKTSGQRQAIKIPERNDIYSRKPTHPAFPAKIETPGRYGWKIG